MADVSPPATGTGRRRAHDRARAALLGAGIAGALLGGRALLDALFGRHWGGAVGMGGLLGGGLYVALRRLQGTGRAEAAFGGAAMAAATGFWFFFIGSL